MNQCPCSLECWCLPLERLMYIGRNVKKRKVIIRITSEVTENQKNDWSNTCTNVGIVVVATQLKGMCICILCSHFHSYLSSIVCKRSLAIHFVKYPRMTKHILDKMKPLKFPLLLQIWDRWNIKQPLKCRFMCLYFYCISISNSNCISSLCLKKEDNNWRTRMPLKFPIWYKFEIAVKY